MKRASSKAALTTAQRIRNQIAELSDWRGKMLSQLRKVILGADPGIAEEWKWNTAVWTCNELVCGACAFRDHVKLNFFNGASLKDPKGAFNAGLDAKNSRAIGFAEGNSIDWGALRDLIRAAVAHNLSAGKRNRRDQPPYLESVLLSPVPKSIFDEQRMKLSTS